MKQEELIKMYMQFIKITFCMLFVFGAMVLVSQVRAEDNKTKAWNTESVVDNVNACYQGTYRWILLANPALIGKTPPPIVQRQMMQHCFCVMDKVRTEYPIKKSSHMGYRYIYAMNENTVWDHRRALISPEK